MEIDELYAAIKTLTDAQKKTGEQLIEEQRRKEMFEFCEKCFEQGILTPVGEVHHIVPISKGGTHARSNLMSLCRSCHNKIHHELGDR